MPHTDLLKPRRQPIRGLVVKQPPNYGKPEPAPREPEGAALRKQAELLPPPKGSKRIERFQEKYAGLFGRETVKRT